MALNKQRVELMLHSLSSLGLQRPDDSIAVLKGPAMEILKIEAIAHYQHRFHCVMKITIQRGFHHFIVRGTIRLST